MEQLTYIFQVMMGIHQIWDMLVGCLYRNMDVNLLTKMDTKIINFITGMKCAGSDLLIEGHPIRPDPPSHESKSDVKVSFTKPLH